MRAYACTAKLGVENGAAMITVSAVSESVLAVSSPYHAGFIEDVKKLGGRWDKTRKVWLVPTSRWPSLEAVVYTHYGVRPSMGAATTHPHIPPPAPAPVSTTPYGMLCLVCGNPAHAERCRSCGIAPLCRACDHKAPCYNCTRRDMLAAPTPPLATIPLPTPAPVVHVQPAPAALSTQPMDDRAARVKARMQRNAAER